MAVPRHNHTRYPCKAWSLGEHYQRDQTRKKYIRANKDLQGDVSAAGCFLADGALRSGTQCLSNAAPAHSRSGETRQKRSLKAFYIFIGCR